MVYFTPQSSRYVDPSIPSRVAASGGYGRRVEAFSTPSTTATASQQQQVEEPAIRHSLLAQCRDVLRAVEQVQHDAALLESRVHTALHHHRNSVAPDGTSNVAAVTNLRFVGGATAAASYDATRQAAPTEGHLYNDEALRSPPPSTTREVFGLVELFSAACDMRVQLAQLQRRLHNETQAAFVEDPFTGNRGDESHYYSRGSSSLPQTHTSLSSSSSPSSLLLSGDGGWRNILGPSGKASLFVPVDKTATVLRPSFVETDRLHRAHAREEAARMRSALGAVEAQLASCEHQLHMALFSVAPNTGVASTRGGVGARESRNEELAVEDDDAFTVKQLPTSRRHPTLQPEDVRVAVQRAMQSNPHYARLYQFEQEEAQQLQQQQQQQRQQHLELTERRHTIQRPRSPSSSRPDPGPSVLAKISTMSLPSPAAVRIMCDELQRHHNSAAASPPTEHEKVPEQPSTLSSEVVADVATAAVAPSIVSQLERSATDDAQRLLARELAQVEKQIARERRRQERLQRDDVEGETPLSSSSEDEEALVGEATTAPEEEEEEEEEAALAADLVVGDEASSHYQPADAHTIFGRNPTPPLLTRSSPPLSQHGTAGNEEIDGPSSPHFEEFSPNATIAKVEEEEEGTGLEPPQNASMAHDAVIDDVHDDLKEYLPQVAAEMDAFDVFHGDAAAVHRTDAPAATPSVELASLSSRTRSPSYPETPAADSTRHDGGTGSPPPPPVPQPHHALPTIPTFLEFRFGWAKRFFSDPVNQRDYDWGPQHSATLQALQEKGTDAVVAEVANNDAAAAAVEAVQEMLVMISPLAAEDYALTLVDGGLWEEGGMTDAQGNPCYVEVATGVTVWSIAEHVLRESGL